MIVNKMKTEMVAFDRNTVQKLTLPNGITSRENMKMLGITMTWNLNWGQHVDKTVSRNTQIESGIKFIRRWVGNDAAIH